MFKKLKVMNSKVHELPVREKTTEEKLRKIDDSKDEQRKEGQKVPPPPSRDNE